MKFGFKSKILAVTIVMSNLVPLNGQENSDTCLMREKYKVKRGDTVSELLYDRGLRGNKFKFLYYEYIDKTGAESQTGVLSESQWRKLQPGTELVLVYPGSKADKEAGKCIDLAEKKEVKKEECNCPTVAAASAPVEEDKFYPFEHRASLMLGLTYNRESSSGNATLASDDNRVFPRIDYSLYYKTDKDNVRHFQPRAWAYYAANMGINGIYIPARYSLEAGVAWNKALTIGSNTNFNPGLTLMFDRFGTLAFNNVGRTTNTLWIGLRPEFRTYFSENKKFIEYIPFLYRSIVSESEGTRMGGWDFGIDVNAAIAMKGMLMVVGEYHCDYLTNSGPTLKIISHNLTAGMGLRF